MRDVIHISERCARGAAVLAICCAAMAQTADVQVSGAQNPRAGNQWTVHFADGGKVKYRLMPLEAEPGVALFEDKSGHEVKIMVAGDARVLIVPSEGGCYRTGTLVDGRVTNGTSGGDCKPGGAWTADVR